MVASHSLGLWTTPAHAWKELSQTSCTVLACCRRVGHSHQLFAHNICVDWKPDQGYLQRLLCKAVCVVCCKWIRSFDFRACFVFSFSTGVEWVRLARQCQPVNLCEPVNLACRSAKGFAALVVLLGNSDYQEFCLCRV